MLNEILPNIDYLFGNDGEYLAFAKAKGYKTTDLKEIGKLIANEPKVKGTRIVVITQGPGPVLVAKTNDQKGWCFFVVVEKRFSLQVPFHLQPVLSSSSDRISSAAD